MNVGPAICGSLLLAATIRAETLPTSVAMQRREIRFETNRGQWRNEIRYAARGETGSVLFLSDRIIFSRDGERIELLPVGMNGNSRMIVSEPVEGSTNYLIGRDSRAWKVGVPSYRRITWENVYPSTDITFHADNSALEFDVVVHPGGDLSRVRFRAAGATVTKEHAEVTLKGTRTSIRMRTPAVYFVDGSVRRPLDGKVAVDEHGTISFETAHYDASKTLVFDPTLAFSTYLGGSGSDATALQIAADAEGSLVVAGDTDSSDFDLHQPLQNAYSGKRDIFISKINTVTGKTLFTTYLGGSDRDTLSAVRIGDNRAIYLAGTTRSADFPVVGALQNALRGSSDAFVAKITGAGDRLNYATYFGGSDADECLGMALDSDGATILTGNTYSDDLPVANAVQSSRGGDRDAFLAKLTATAVAYCTYLGGTSSDDGSAVALDAAGNVYIAGETSSTDSPLHWPGGSGSSAGYVAELDKSGASLRYAAFVGGSGAHPAVPRDIAVDSNGRAVVVGAAQASDLPVTNALRPTMGGGESDGFVGRISADGSRFDFLTYLGGEGTDTIETCALNADGEIYVAGRTTSTDFPVANAIQSQYGGSTASATAGDMIIARLTSDGASLQFSTFLGGPQDEWALDISVTDDGLLYVGGATNSTSFPVVHAVQSTFGGTTDAVLLSIRGYGVPFRQTGTVPVVGSTAGALGSRYRTSAQFHNASRESVPVKVVLHRATWPPNEGEPDTDVTATFSVPPNATEGFQDIVESMNTTGIGTVDVIAERGELPVTVVRVFNDANALGTSGMTEELFSREQVLQAGMSGVLIVPPDSVATRFNIGIRTFDHPLTMGETIVAPDGSHASTATWMWSANSFEQIPISEWTQTNESLANHAIVFTVTSGSAILYGVANDNITQDPNIQFARPLGTETSPRIIPVIASTPGLFGSRFKTAVQIHNATDTPVTGKLVFHPQGTPASAGDPALAYSLGRGQTIWYDDLLPAMGAGGIGTLDILPENGQPPVSVVRVFNDAGAKGTTGMTEEQVAPDQELKKGQRGVLIAPLDPSRFRYNIGVRSGTDGADMTVTIRSRAGAVIKSFPLSYPPNTFMQNASQDLLGMSLGPSDSISFHIDNGSAIVYGATTDNTTQDPSQQVARSVAE